MAAEGAAARGLGGALVETNAPVWKCLRLRPGGRTAGEPDESTNVRASRGDDGGRGGGPSRRGAAGAGARRGGPAGCDVRVRVRGEAVGHHARRADAAV